MTAPYPPQVLGVRLRRFGQVGVRGDTNFVGRIGRLRVKIFQDDGVWHGSVKGIGAQYQFSLDGVGTWYPEEAAERLTAALRSLGFKNGGRR